MKKVIPLLTALFVLGSAALFADECKKCAGDKEAKCTCGDKSSKSCEKDKGACPKDAKPSPGSEKKQ